MSVCIIAQLKFSRRELYDRYLPSYPCELQMKERPGQLRALR